MIWVSSLREQRANNHAQTRSLKPTTPSPGSESCHSLHFVRDFVDVDAAVVGFLLVITIPALRKGKGCEKGVAGKGLRGGLGRDWKGRLGFPQRSGMTTAWSFEAGIMGYTENHLGDGQDSGGSLVGQSGGKTKTRKGRKKK